MQGLQGRGAITVENARIRLGCSDPAALLFRPLLSAHSLDAVDQPRTHLGVEGPSPQKAYVQRALAHRADQPHPRLPGPGNAVELCKELLMLCHGLRTRAACWRGENLLLLVEVGV
jgi:hypothetical protein